MRKLSLILNLAFCLIAYNSYADIENVPVLDDSTAPVVNENFRTLNNNVNAAANAASTTSGYFTNGVLNTANGGTGHYTYTDGQVLIGSASLDTLVPSTITAGTGISITNASGSITVANTQVQSSTAYANNIKSIVTNNDTSDRIIDTAISSTGDWGTKKWMFIGNFGWDYTTINASASSVDFLNTSTTAWSGLQGNSTSTSSSGTGSVVIDSNNSTLKSLACGGIGTCACSIVISSGNLYLRLNRSGASGNSVNSCALQGMIIREP